MRATRFWTAGPTQSGANATSLPSQRWSRLATGARLSLGSNFPLGRPRCEQRMTLAPSSIARLMVGSVDRILVSSATCNESSRGTLKSARMMTRLLDSCRSSMVRLCRFTAPLLPSCFTPPTPPAVRMWRRTMKKAGRAGGAAFYRDSPRRSSPRRDELDEIADAARIPPLVVVPGRDLDEAAFDHCGQRRIQGRGVGVSLLVDRHDRLFAILQNAFERSVGCAPEGRVDGRDIAVSLGFDGQIDQRHVRRGDADRHAIHLPFELRQDQVQR